MKDIKVSFCVPAYNVEKFIYKCISSILSQTLKEIEVIAVNDGSTDRTLEILNSFDDYRLKIITKQNEGSSSARNDAIAFARGKYIVNVDGDDFIHQDYAKDTYEMAENTNSDIVICDFFKFYDDNNIIYVSDYKVKKNGVIKDNVSYAKDIIFHRGGGYHVVWNKLIRRSLLVDYKFPNGIFMSDDYCVYAKITYNAKTISKINKPLYYYRIGDNNQSSISNKLSNMADSNFVYTDMINWVKKNINDNKEYVDFLWNNKIIVFYRKMLFVKPNLLDNTYLQAFKILKNDIDFIIKCPVFKDMKIKYKFMFYCVKYIKNDKILAFVINIFGVVMTSFSKRKRIEKLI
ncbi:hypothetical protein BB381_03790 [Campylobacter pinnipediorum subsp. caledonicus]|uniref:glycosyltransferase family 2 protein n=1 Tax=Campylobacter pinnipediorum TaxID=1965231 RepID=UPI0009955BEF|nr:glycosyltransferase family 2 protein [Campylobacter pinnipediorum]OPA71623.1 hypothetical protein BB381_03790 [Campylobacter pinnipediorum subsp. caledonicus]